MSGNLYQLRSRTRLRPGSPYTVNGPFDMFGYVIKSEHKPDDNKAEPYLNLIRGTGNTERYNHG